MMILNRRQRRIRLNIFFFLAALVFILYLNRPQSTKEPFAWTEIRYKTTAKSLPESRGVCPGLNEYSLPALVVSHVAADGSTSWLTSLQNSYHVCLYHVDAPLDKTSYHLQTPANRGHESISYLTFLIDNYENIPAAGAVFVHGSRWAWHNDHREYDNLALLNALNMTSALEHTGYGYHNLRCDWSASMCPPDSAPPQGSLETSMNAILEPYNARVVSDAALPRALSALFGGDDPDSVRKHGRLVPGRSEAIRAQCCAQFAVAREMIWRHTRSEYVAIRQWLLDTNSQSAPADDRVAGRILSYVWHILFMPYTGEGGNVNLEVLNKLACPSAKDCYARLYGLDLERCTTESCRDHHYSVPKNYKLPAEV